jgi:hypothetical protein
MLVLRTSAVVLLGLLLCGTCDAGINGVTDCSIEAPNGEPCWDGDGSGPWEEWDEWMYCVRNPASNCMVK